MIRARVVLFLALALLPACSARIFEDGTALTTAPPPEPDRHVVLISIDGLRPDAIDVFGAATIQRLAREGRYAYDATTIVPSKTLPSHTSMLTGFGPERHGVLWNTPATARDTDIGDSTVFAQARRQGYVTAAFFSKSKFHTLQKRGTLDYTQAPGGWFGHWDDERTASDVEAYLMRARPHLLFVHLGGPDRAGHAEGWMSPAYGRAVSVSDAVVARLVSAASQAFGPDGFTLILTADHGGHERDHGSDDPRDVTIPWIAWGRDVDGTGAIEGRHVHTTDTAATVLWLLRVAPPAGVSGRPVTEAFAAGIGGVRTTARRLAAQGAT